MSAKPVDTFVAEAGTRLNEFYRVQQKARDAELMALKDTDTPPLREELTESEWWGRFGEWLVEKGLLEYDE